jgi:hypothetical protein
MQPLHLETFTAGADCAVLRIAGEVDVYSAPQLVSASSSFSPTASRTSSRTSAG